MREASGCGTRTARVFFLVNVELHIEIQDGQLIRDTIHPHLSTGAI